MTLKDKDLREIAEAVARHGTISAAAEALGIGRRVAGYRYKIYKEQVEAEAPKAVEIDPFPAGDLSAPELIEHMVTRFKKRKELAQSKNWFPVRVNIPGPIGIGFMGDPHVDDDGCDWPLLQKHCDIFRETEGLFGINLGDSHNNWVGRLMRLYAHQETSRSTALRLVRWLFQDSGVHWLLIILGNHDSWNEGGDILKAYADNVCPCENWEAKFRLIFPNGVEIRNWVAHSFKGNSIYNPLHGPLRAALLRERAHLFAAGHIHTAATMKLELEGGHHVDLIRARGYKIMDEHAMVHGFAEQDMGATVMAVYNPYAQSQDDLITTFTNFERGADYLRYLRKRWHEGKSLSGDCSPTE